MILRAAAAALGLLAGSLGSAGLAGAQYYPPSSYPPSSYPPSSRPYYPAPYRLVPPADIDEDDPPLGSLPSDYERPAGRPMPNAGLPPDAYPAYGPPPYGPPPYPPGARATPGAIEREALPPPGFDPYQRPIERAGPGQPPAQPGYGAPVVIRPPAEISPGQQQNLAPGQPQNLASLPPDVRPEVGEVKELPAHLRRQAVDHPSREPAGTIIIDTPNTYLYLVLGGGKAMRYGIGVGREGFTWSGTQRVARMAEWPDWIPPQEMIERQPYLPRFMAGGPGNPLGARALYLGNTLYRIHGTNQPSTIGSFVSSGCIRLLNEDIEDLYGRVTVGSRVVVLPKPDTASAGDPREPLRIR